MADLDETRAHLPDVEWDEMRPPNSREEQLRYEATFSFDEERHYENWHCSCSHCNRAASEVSVISPLLCDNEMESRFFPHTEDDAF